MTSNIRLNYEKVMREKKMYLKNRLRKFVELRKD